ncbi:hypothetical protein V8F63_05605 [Brevundimonas sp. LF-1]|uniref:hypothetical protein n=1 Tax=Brevundimonas sp. LF-1 TaxID=3126100 RepID=UPI0030E2241E
MVRSEGLRSAYLRPLAFLGECGMGVSPSPENIRTDVMISAFPWGAYLGEEALEKGVDACISSWNRVAPNTIPSGAKAGGNYLSGYLIGREAACAASAKASPWAPTGCCPKAQVRTCSSSRTGC